MIDQFITFPGKSDEDVAELLKPLIHKDAHPTLLPKAIAAYRELEERPLEEVAVLFATQQVLVEGLSQALEKANQRDEVKLAIDSVSNGGIVMPRRIKPAQN